ncbi:dienelactone hydrolase [Chitinivorax tropicus]|uniref:Dienelactone hydrolase n=1 Tax=Chitinivorax tropicus TaxID=714531 RepID=A0A840MF14_9PROT|nr:dienelactone hydrolase family protein [Chitinivorax tropicus]MBB5017854.1 dienelactone hydrolase [Chitinivorax tropicus]
MKTITWRAVFCSVVLCATSQMALAAKGEVVTYKQGDTELEGYLAWPDKMEGKRPAVLIFHDWTGVGDYVKGRAKQLADLGYVAFAADIYGKGVRPAFGPEAAKVSGQFYKDRDLLHARLAAGYDWLKERKEVNPDKIVGMGYCFGGMAALELARMGTPVAGAISFHGNLGNPTPETAKQIKGKVLVLHGAIDPYVKPEQVDAFMKEMNAANVDYQFIAYSGAVHSFTQPHVGTDISKGAAYNAAADRRSFEAMKTFLHEVFQ